MIEAPSTTTHPPPLLSHAELVGLVAALMAIGALSIDVMLPALPQIGASLGVQSDNDRQLVIVVYVMAAGFAQLIYGPLADALGRRKVLVGSLGLSVIATALCAASYSFPLFLAARGIQGVSNSAARVVAMALVRDLSVGRRMAQIMSTAMTIFMIVPILAPGIGQLILLFGAWRGVFVMLLSASLSVLLWVWLRLPETLPLAMRIPMSVRGSLRAYRQVIESRVTLGYTLAQTFGFGAMFAYLTSAQQVFGEVFELGALFPLAFASVAVALTAAQFANARFVMRFGMHRLSHAAALAFFLVSALHAVYAHAVGSEPLAVFLGLLLPSMFMFGFVNANFSAIAMEPMGKLAGSASAFTGFVTTVGGALFGGVVGRAFDGTTAPLLTGHALLGLGTVLVVLITERGRLFSGSTP
jgi:MFS transporter, DHA1 family, multidrug resistance protein